MRKTLTILAFLAVLAGRRQRLPTTTASCPCPTGSRARRWPGWPESKGWTVRRIKIDDGCYEIDGRDAEGRGIEVTVHPATLEVIGIEYEEEDDADDRLTRCGWSGRDLHTPGSVCAPHMPRLVRVLPGHRPPRSPAGPGGASSFLTAS